MLENQFFPKSSDTIHNGPIADSHDSQSENSNKIFFDPQSAIEQFDVEAKISIAGHDLIASFLRNAQLLMKHRDYSLAMNLLRQASNKESKNPLTLSLLTTCLEKLGKSQEALIAYRALISVDYGFESLFGYATCLYKLGRDQEALDKYYEALAVLTEENENLFELYKNMGNIFVRRGDFDAAEEYYNKAYTMNPSSDVLLVNFGTLEVQRSDFDKSLYCFRKAIEINPENDKAWVGLAMVHNQFTDTELAWANIETALDINKKNRTAVHLAANWGIRDGKIQKAIDFLQSYLGSVEEDEEMSLVLINLFCSSGQLESALIEMERVLLWNPEHQEVRALQKKILLSRKAN
ncbi:MAG: tetratricopeptide repeat protein [Pseudobdellovibrionaceae bacterium]